MIRRARALRGNMTEAEKVLWGALRRDALGARFRRQVVFDRSWILDFYAPSAKLAIEVDGGQHSEGADRARTAYLASRGVTVLRFWNNEVLENLEGVCMAVDAVLAALSGKTSPLAPLPREGGIGADVDLGALRLTFGKGV